MPDKSIRIAIPPTRHNMLWKGCDFMSVGMILLAVVAILIFIGVAQRVLDKMYLSDKMALLLVALMFLGTLVPNITIGLVSFSLGGAVIPLGVCVFLLIRADTWQERLRALLGAAVTGAVVYLLSMMLPSEPEETVIEPIYLYGLVGGLVAYILGRSRRGAFICGVLGVMLADTATAIVNWSQGRDQLLVLGGAGVFDALVISGLIGVLLCELIGEIIERISRGKNPPSHQRVDTPVPHAKKEGSK